MRLKFAGGFLSGVVLWSSVAAAEAPAQGGSAPPAPSASTQPSAPTPGAPRAPAASGASRPQAAIGFSKLVFRAANDLQIAASSGEVAVFVLESLRAQGFNAVGAENLVFDQDRSRDAEFVLGGTLTEFECLNQHARLNCRIAIEWQLLDVASNAVRYTALTRGVFLGADPKDPGLGKALLTSALNSLLRRQPFLSQLAQHEARHLPELPSYSKATYASCRSVERAMPAAAEQLLPATVLIQNNKGFGSGFFLNDEGLVVTAAHVVGSGPLKVRLRDGNSYAARVLRVATRVDAALLKVDGLSAATACLPLALEPQRIGSEVYAIGAPASQTLAFSLTRGIVSGTREIEGQPLLQTDASVNPGNSGGPLVNAKGRAAAIVSFKLTGEAIQGLSFGIPIASVLQALALDPGTGTDGALLAPAENRSDAVAYADADRPFVDQPDALPNIDIIAEQKRRDAEQKRLADEREREAAEQKRLADERSARLAELRYARTPTGVKVMRYSGLGIAAIGGIAVLQAQVRYEEGKSTRDEYEQLSLVNGLGWAGVAVGLGAFAISYAFVPKMTEDDLDGFEGAPKKAPAKPAPAKVSLGVRASDVQVKVQF